MQLSNLAALLPSFSISIVVDLLEEAGIDAAPALLAAGLTRAALDAPGLLVTGAQELAVQRAFAELTVHRRDLWVLAGSRYQMMTYYPLGFAQITAPTFGDALGLIRRFATLHYALAHFDDCSDGDGSIGIVAVYDDQLRDIEAYLRCRDVISVTNWFHELWGGTFPFTRIESSSALPAAAGFDYRANVTLGPQTRWFWPRAVMDTPLPHADAVLHKIYVAQSEAIVATSAAGQGAPRQEDPLLQRVAALIETSGPRQWTLDRMAKELCVSRRSLQRSLMNKGQSFRTILDTKRCEAAKRLVADDAAPIAEIAWKLGYTDSSSFHQAFMRWTQMSPSAYRRRSRLATLQPPALVPLTAYGAR